MTYEYEKKLRDKFDFYNNKLFSNFECEDGWFELIWELSEEIKKQLDELPNKNKFKVLQVKEKFGGLRFYTTHVSDDIETLISEYEKKSYIVCEFCGWFGEKQDIGGWMKVICKKCKCEHGRNF